eukprot:2040700-Prymnesium_polylepis.1
MCSILALSLLLPASLPAADVAVFCLLISRTGVLDTVCEYGDRVLCAARAGARSVRRSDERTPAP